MSERPPIPVTVISGFLGAGKTTLLNHLLADPRGRPLLVLVNDFGAVDIDQDLIVSRDTQTVSLANGCVCCTVQHDLIGVLSGLARLEAPPEHIVIEASGIADPANLAELFELGRFEPAIPLAAVITVADAELVREQVEDWAGRVVLRQLASADLIVLSKTDIVEPDTLATTRAWLAQVTPHTPVIEATRGRVPAELLLMERDPPCRSGEGREVAPRGEDRLAHGFAVWSHTTAEMFDSDALRTALSKLPTGIVRAKGIVRIAEAPERRTVVHVVGRRIDISDGGPWAEASATSRGPADESRLVVIGQEGAVDARALAALIDGALAPGRTRARRPIADAPDR